MKYITFCFFAIAMTTTSSASTNSNLMHELDERLTNLELSQANNRIDVGIQFKNFFGFFDIKDRNPANNLSDYSGEDTDKRSRMASVFRLEANAKLSSRLKLFSQIEANFNSNSQFNTNNVPEFNSTYKRRGIFIYLKKAYFDYHLNKMMSLSMGRLSTTQGPPQNIRNNSAREGTYPLASFSVPLDGVAGTFRFDLSKETKLILRSIYVPGGIGSSEDESDSSYQVMTSSTTSTLAEDSRGFTQMIELRNSSTKWKELLMIVQASTYSFGAMKDAYFFNTDSAAGLPTGEYRVHSTGSRLGDIYLLTSYFQVDKLMLLPMTFYFSHTYSKIKRRGSIALSGTANPFTNLQEFGFLSDDDVSGNRYLIGMNWEFESENFIGFEGIQSTKYSIPTGAHTDELLSFVNLNGRDLHFYIGTPFGNGQSNIRLGVHHFKYNQKITANKFIESSERMQMGYLLFNLSI